MLTSFLDVPDKFGDFGASFGTFHIFGFNFLKLFTPFLQIFPVIPMFLFCPLPKKKGLVGSQFSRQIGGYGGHFGGKKAKWRIWRTKWLNGGQPPDWMTLYTYGQSKSRKYLVGKIT